MQKGQKIRITPARKMVLELLHHAQKVPTVPQSSMLQLHPRLLSLRKKSGLTWMTLWLKAYGILAARHPVLRRTFVSYPRMHLFEHPENNGVVLVEREHEGESIILAALAGAVEKQSLIDLNHKLKEFKDTPVEKDKNFRRIFRLGKMPWILRRIIFHFLLHWSGRMKARKLGTFMVSSQGVYGSEQEHPLHFHTSYMTFGPIDDLGKVNVRIIYDHRVTDGRVIARLFSEIESIMNQEILEEVLRFTEQDRPFLAA